MIPLEWTAIESSRIRKAKYEPNPHDLRGDLLVEFNEGRKYRFKDVPQHHIEKMVHNTSPGTYFHSHIRGNFEAEAVDD